MRPNRIFLSLDEVESYLPQIKSISSRLNVIHGTISMLSNVRINNGTQNFVIGLKKDYYKAQYDYHNCLEELSNLGCIIKHIHNGYIDFASFLDGRRIYYCWRIGESGIKYYHPTKINCDNRRKIEFARGLG